MPAAGPHEPLLDRYADHLRAVRNLAPSTVANSRHYVACFLDWWEAEHAGQELDEVRARHIADHLVAEAERGLQPGRSTPRSTACGRSSPGWCPRR